MAEHEHVPSDTVAMDSPDQPTLLVRLGRASWSMVGLFVVLVILLGILGAVSEVAIPVVMGAYIAVVMKPLSDALRGRGMRPIVAVGLVLGGLVAVMVGVGAAVVGGLTSQSDEISASMDAAVESASTELGVAASSLAAAREAIEGLGPLIGAGGLTTVVSGVGAIIGFASGLMLAMIVMYYMLKDGSGIRRSLVGKANPGSRAELDDFIGESCRTLRAYTHGRTVLAALVAVVMGLTSALLGLPLILSIVVVTFVGGYIPYIGAFVAGAYTVLLALGNGGVGPAVIIILVSLAANVLLENFVQPRIMGESLDVHPLVVLIVTALGGLIGGIIGLVVAVPLAIITGSAIGRLRSSGNLELAAAKARPAADRLLGTIRDTSPDAAVADGGS